MSSPIKVLLIEDNVDYARMLRLRLSGDTTHVFQLENAIDLRTALESVSRQPFDLILMDVFLPDARGMDVFRQIHVKAPLIPVIILSALDDENLALEAVREGAEEYLIKGTLDGKMLSRVIRYTIERHRMKNKLNVVTQELQESNIQLKLIASQDPLTGLLNRRGLQEALSREIAWSRRDGSSLISILIDLDDFKRINDTFGHAVGDVMLQEVARKIKACLRVTDYKGRIGGDEFLVLLPQTRITEGLEVAEKLRLSLSEAPLVLSKGEVRITASLGVVVVSDQAPSVDELLAKTYLALDRSKRFGKNRVSSGEKGGPVDKGIDEARSKIIDALRSGDSIRAVKHPIFRLADEVEMGFEFLSRLNIPTFEMPDDFFRICSEANILTTVDHQCFKICAAAASSVSTQGRCHLNLFPSTLIDIPPAHLLEAFGKDRRSGAYCIEISEQQIIGDPSYLRDSVNAFKKEGVRVAIDDVGFGRSCLESLILLEPDIIKIDKKCVIGISRDKWRERSVERLMKIAGSLDAEVVAEGIETREDLKVLLHLGVKYGQGFLWGKPA